MRRRTLMMSASAAALGLTGVATASAQTTQTLRFGYALPEDSSLGAGAKVFETEITRRTGGRYRIEVSSNAKLGSETDMLKHVQRGTIDLAFVTSAPLPNYVLEVGVFSIPFIFSDASHAHDMLDSAIGLACLEKFRDSDIVALAWGENGMRQLTNSRRPIKTPRDLRGLKLGLPQSAVMMIGLEALGADVSAAAFSDLFDDLHSGRFDGQENSLATIRASNFCQVQKHLTLSNHIYDPAVVVMSTNAHGALSAEDQDAFAEAAKLAGLASRQYAAEALSQGGIETLRQSGMQLVRQIDREEFLAALSPVQWKFESLFGTDLVRWVQNAG